MQAFEFYFNPKLKENLFFETFCYQPENIYEKKRGHLFIFGEIENTSKKNFSLIKDLAYLIKKEFYSPSAKGTSSALKDALKKANNFLNEIAQGGEIDWISNLNFAVCVITPVSLLKKKKYHLIVAKTGKVKIILLRQGKIIDIGKDIDENEIEPYPLKVFINFLSGNLEEKDSLMVLSFSVFDFLIQKGVIEKLARLPSFSQKEINRALKFSRKEITNLSGAFLFINLNEDQKEKRFIFKKPRLGFLERLQNSPLLHSIKKAFNFLFHPFNNLLFSLKEKLDLFPLKIKQIKKEIFLVLFFLLLIFSGILLGSFQPKPPSSEKEKKEFITTEKNLFLNNPPVFVFEREKPKKIIYNDGFYFIFPSKKEIWYFSENSSDPQIVSLEGEIALVSLFEKGIVVFLKTNDLIGLEKEKIIFKEKIEKNPYYVFSNLKTYNQNLYFFEKNTKTLIKCFHENNYHWPRKEIWASFSKPITSFAIDGGIWTIEENIINYYFLKEHKKTLSPSLVPPLTSADKIITFKDWPYLIVWEKENQRIVVLNKEGVLVEEIKNTLLKDGEDISLDKKNRTIFVLMDNKVYKLTFSN